MPPNQLRYDVVHSFVRSYVNGFGEATHYDANGVIHLLLAALDNLGEHFTEGDLDQFAASVTPAQRELLTRITKHINESTADGCG